jgi:hypothetical protein
MNQRTDLAAGDKVYRFDGAYGWPTAAAAMGKPLDNVELERGTRVGFERGDEITQGRTLTWVLGSRG